MEFNRRLIFRVLAGVAATPSIHRIAGAQDRSAQEVRIIVGFPAGGPLDIVARVVAPWLASRLGQPFVVENRPGASGNIATAEVVGARPDGRTLLLCGPVHTINTTLYQGLGFDFARDIAPVASIARVPLVVEVNPAVAPRAVPEFIAYAKANPGALKVAYAGNGTPQHIAIELFRMMTGADITPVAYLGSAPALADLLAGKVQVMFDPLPSSIGHIRAGRLVPLAVTSTVPSAALPGIPAMSDHVPGYEGGSWFGIGAPRATPADIVDRLGAAIGAALDDPGIRARLAELGASTMPGTPGQFRDFIARETEKFAMVIRSAGIRAS